MRPRPVRALMLGFPNVGKSALINRLVRQKVVDSARRAGVTRTLRWVRAGHDPAFFYDPTSGAIEEVRGEGIALGIDATYAYRQSVKKGLSAGQILLIGTDGIWETLDDSGRMFGKTRLAALIREHASYSSEILIQAIMTALKDFRGSPRQEDDVTLAVVKIVD